MTDTTPVPPVPSRDAVDTLAGRLVKFANMDQLPDRQIGYTDVEQAELDAAAMLRTLLAEVERLTDWQNRHIECVSELRATVAEQGAALRAASHALRSYQYGNSATELAEQAANACDAAIASAQSSAPSP